MTRIKVNQKMLIFAKPIRKKDFFIISKRKIKLVKISHLTFRTYTYLKIRNENVTRITKVKAFDLNKFLKKYTKRF